MKTEKLRDVIIVMLVLVARLPFSVNAAEAPSTYRTITVDGSFSDWTNVPAAWSQAKGATTTSMAYSNIWVCNDSDYLYLRFSIYPPATVAFVSSNNIYINGDNETGTGYDPTGNTGFGSKMLIQSGIGYQQTAGSFNAGEIAGLNWQGQPTKASTDFECRISRHSTYVSDGKPVFTTNTIMFVLEAQTGTYANGVWAPDIVNGAGFMSYTFAPAPGQPGSLLKTSSPPPVPKK